MKSIEYIEVDYESLVRNISEKISFFEVIFKLNQQPYRMIFKKEALNKDWMPYEIIEEGEDFFTSVTDSFTDGEYEKITSFLLNHKEVQAAFSYFNTKTIEEEADNQDPNDKVRKIGERIWKKVCKEIQCGFTIDNGHYIFILPIPGFTNSLKISLQEIMFSHDSEDAFVEYAVQSLKSIDKNSLHPHFEKNRNDIYLGPYHHMRFQILCDQFPEQAKSRETSTLLFMAAGDDKLASYLLPYLTEVGFNFVDLQLENNLDSTHTILLKLAATLYDCQYYEVNVGDFAKLDERYLKLALSSVQFRYL